MGISVKSTWRLDMIRQLYFEKYKNTPQSEGEVPQDTININDKVGILKHIARNDRWFAYLHIQNGGSKIIWILTYSWTGNFLLAWAGQFSGIKNQTMHWFEQYLKILQLYHENSRFPPSFKFWSVSTIQKHWEEVKKCILHGFQDLKALFLQSPF